MIDSLKYDENNYTYIPLSEEELVENKPVYTNPSHNDNISDKNQSKTKPDFGTNNILDTDQDLGLERLFSETESLNDTESKSNTIKALDREIESNKQALNTIKSENDIKDILQERKYLLDQKAKHLSSIDKQAEGYTNEVKKLANELQKNVNDLVIERKKIP